MGTDTGSAHWHKELRLFPCFSCGTGGGCREEASLVFVLEHLGKQGVILSRNEGKGRGWRGLKERECEAIIQEFGKLRFRKWDQSELHFSPSVFSCTVHMWKRWTELGLKRFYF